MTLLAHPYSPTNIDGSHRGHFPWYYLTKTVNSEVLFTKVYTSCHDCVKLSFVAV